jgi:hypothetical protein
MIFTIGFEFIIMIGIINIDDGTSVQQPDLFFFEKFCPL